MGGKERQKYSGGRGGFLGCRHLGSRKEKLKWDGLGLWKVFTFHAILHGMKPNSVKWLSQFTLLPANCLTSGEDLRILSKFKSLGELFSVKYCRIYRKGRPSVTAELLIFSGVNQYPQGAGWARSARWGLVLVLPARVSVNEYLAPGLGFQRWLCCHYWNENSFLSMSFFSGTGLITMPHTMDSPQSVPKAVRCVYVIKPSSVNNLRGHMIPVPRF